MKKWIWLLVWVFVLSACQKDQETVIYQVIYQNEQGQVLHEKTIEHGQPLGDVNLDLSRTGSVFLHWTDPEGVIYDKDDSVVKDLILTSVYEQTTYQITFETLGGSAILPITAHYGEEVMLDSINPTKSGSRFCGWSSSLDQIDSIYTLLMPDHDVTLYATWCLNTYQLTYHYFGNQTMVKTFAMGETVIPWVPTYTSYLFDGWYEEDSEEPFDFSSMPERHVNVYARTVEKTYTIHWVTNQDFDFEPTLFKLSDQVLDIRTGYIYNQQLLYGWFYDLEFKQPYTGAIPASSNELTLYALWNPVGLKMHRLYGEDAFLAIANDLNRAGEIIIPETFAGMDVIGVGGFKNSLYSKVVLPKTIKTISSYVFSSMPNLDEIIFEADSLLESIGHYAFYDSNLRFITLPSQLTSIGYNAFGRTGMRGLWIPESVQSMDTPFSSVNASLYFESNTLPALYNNFYANATLFGYLGTCKDSQFDYIVGPDHAVLISQRDLSSTQHTIPTHACSYPINRIGDYAMYFSNVEQISVDPNSLIESIGDHAFDQSYQLIEFSFPESLKTIGAYAFYRTNLKEIHIPSSVETIGVVAFADNFSETLSISFGSQSMLKVIDISTFYNMRGTIEEIIIPRSVEIIKVNAFLRSKVTRLIFEEGSNLKIIESGAFHTLTNLVNLILPEGLTFIGEKAFAFNTSLQHVYIPSTVVTIEAYAFIATSIPLFEVDSEAKPLGFHEYWIPANQIVIYLKST